MRKESNRSIREVAIQCLTSEAQAVSDLIELIDDNFINAVEIILNCRGRTVLTGIGKSGHIGAKISATLASTGTPSFYLHPVEAAHGDLGMLKANDVVIILSHSGETKELVNILPNIKSMGVKIILITGNRQSTLANESDSILNTGVEKEADPRGQAPTSSAIATLALGDALAISVSVERGFTSEDFLRYHPGGSLGTQAKRKTI